MGWLSFSSAASIWSNSVRGIFSNSGCAATQRGEALVFFRSPAAFESGAVAALVVELEVIGVFEAVNSAELMACSARMAGIKITPSGSWRGPDPRQNDGAPDADGSVDGGEFHLGPGRRIVPEVHAVEVGDFAVLLLIANPGIEDEAGVAARGNGVAQVGADEGAPLILPKPSATYTSPVLQFGNGPGVGVRDAAFRLAFAVDGFAISGRRGMY